jgi:hypothetical protein
MDTPFYLFRREFLLGWGICSDLHIRSSRIRDVHGLRYQIGLQRIANGIQEHSNDLSR